LAGSALMSLKIKGFSTEYQESRQKEKEVSL